MIGYLDEDSPASPLDPDMNYEYGGSRRLRDARRLPLVIGGSIGVLGLLGLLITASPVSLGIIAARADGPATSLASSDSAPFGIDENAVRVAAKAFVDSLGDDVKPHAYYADASKQVPQWQICTIVQQCLVPDYGLAVGRLSPASRTHFFFRSTSTQPSADRTRRSATRRPTGSCG